MLGCFICRVTNINNLYVCVCAGVPRKDFSNSLPEGQILATSTLASRLMTMGWPAASSLYMLQIISLLSPSGLGQGSPLAHQMTDPSSALETVFSKSSLVWFPLHLHFQGNMVPPVPEIWGFSNVEWAISCLPQLTASDLNVFHLLSHLPLILVLSSS